MNPTTPEASLLTDPHHRRVAGLARGFALVATLVPLLWTRDTGSLVALGFIAAIWAAVTLLEWRSRVTLDVIGGIEAAGVGLISGVALDRSPVVLAALAIVPFSAGLYRGIWGVALSLATELFAVLTAALAVRHGITPEQGYSIFSWCFAGLGVGLIATFLHSALQQRADPLAPYLYAQSLLRQLIDISGGFDGGLDPVALGGGILGQVRDELPTSSMALYVTRGETLTPLVTKEVGATMGTGWEDAALAAWATAGTFVEGNLFAVPLQSAHDGSVSAVVVACLSERVSAESMGLQDRLERLRRSLQVGAVQLDTALLFVAFRDSATAEERRRLAREMHDGVAQDIAGLGYLVDALAGTASTPQQAERIAVLRERISAVVAEIRRSLVNLRTSVGASESLGAAIGSIARNLTEVSGVPIHVTLDETTDRLRPEVEAELFRITQEAMNNAIKHARASAIEVHCQVRAPQARITVSDDGRGMQRPRTGSHGLSIMRERALLINATLAMTERDGGGVSVTVEITDGTDDASAAEAGKARVDA
ncbi:histidine kinase [Nocardioides sp. BP30]|uniref:sensor histidine kinase n=1 Tax=Nocardioides sp. BP30 TaxID=3036374 RepID=UPI0024690376|nr:sensor histidine kinase [Nocardioides sp. BP30]WGL53807.1 histidine kinase [Nocardioides sp. BP30]